MTSSMLWTNVVTYSLQVGLLASLAALIPWLLRLRLPGAKLAFWQFALAACIALPLVQPWRQPPVISGSVHISYATMPGVAIATSPGLHLPAAALALAVLCAGAAVRCGWLLIGLWRLRRYRRRSLPLPIPSSWSVEADIRISDHVASPVTFGWLRPVILLPASFPDLDAPLREAILCHEALHVRRRDWLFTAAEELVRAIFWFHPAIWWLLAEIQLAREQAVDRQVVAMTNSRDQYLDALLAIAGAAHGAEPDLALAPLFLRKRHLKQRVISLLKEAQMSKLRTVSSLAAACAALIASCWFITQAFPLSAAPQMVADAPGVSVEMNGTQFLHRSAVAFPSAAIAQGIEGTVVVQVKLDATGNVTDAYVLTGPDELRKPVLQSVLTWHFAKDAANSTRQVSVGFHLPDASRTPRAQGQMSQVTITANGITQTSSQPQQAASPAPAGRIFEFTPTSPTQGTAGHFTYDPAHAGSDAPPQRVSRIIVGGLPSAAQDELLARLSLHTGDTLTPAALDTLTQQARSYDEHLSVTSIRDPSGNAVIMIAAQPSVSMAAPPLPPASQPPIPTGPIPIGGRVQAAKLIAQPQPIYPAEAKAARLSGVVELGIIISPEGQVVDIKVVKGHPLLVPAAIEAVKQWIYQPTLLNGNPVSVSTTIDVNFTLSQ